MVTLGSYFSVEVPHFMNILVPTSKLPGPKISFWNNKNWNFARVMSIFSASQDSVQVMEWVRVNTDFCYVTLVSHDNNDGDDEIMKKGW